MSAAKFPLTALALERDLADGCFPGRLPAVPLLAARYGVSPKVMQRAARLLAGRKLLAPAPRGTWRGPAVPRRLTGVIAVFCAAAALQPEKDPLLYCLRQLIQTDGMTVRFLNDPEDETALGEAMRCDGVIFVYSTFRPEAFRRLAAHGVPGLAANRLPDAYGIPQVSWDHRRVFETILYRLVAEGVRDILCFLAGRAPEITAGSKEIIEDLLAVEKQFQFVVKPTLHYFPAPASGIADFVEFCRRRPRFPDAVICWGQWEALTEQLRRDGRVAGRDYTLVRRPTALNRFQPERWRENWMFRLARAVWKNAKEVLADPASPPRTDRVPFPAQSIEYLIATEKR